MLQLKREIWIVKSGGRVCIVTTEENRAVSWCRKRLEKKSEELELVDHGDGRLSMGLYKGVKTYTIQPAQLNKEVAV